MGWRATVVLAAALAIAAALVYRDVLRDNPDATWESVLSEPQPTPPSADIEPLLSFDPKQVIALHVDRGGTRVDARRDGDTWSGVRRPPAVDDYLASLAELAVVRRLDGAPGEDELAEYGLAPPRALVELDLASGPPLRLLLGDPNPSATGAYCRLDHNGPIIVTGALARWDLDRLMSSLAPTPHPG